MTASRLKTHMAAEVRTIPALTQQLLHERRALAAQLGEQLRKLDPCVVTTIARGSSDHASAYLKYAIELSLGIPVASTGPSISSVYGASMRLEKAASFVISQSGASPDILAMTETARAGGSLILSFTNGASSPLAALSHTNIDIGAGTERSVAATKTFVLSIVAGLMVIAHWSEDDDLLAGLDALPSEFDRALDCDWSALRDHILAEDKCPKSFYILGRGPSFATAQECALKFKETCQLHAEAYSSAEVLHGPVSIAQEGFTALALASNDSSKQSVIESSKRLLEQSAAVFITSDALPSAQALPVVAARHPMTDPLVQVVAFYNFIEKLSRKLGLNPDEPPHLRKVTETI